MFLSATMPSLSTGNQSIDELKEKLFCTEFELIATKMEANREIRKYEVTIKRLFQLLKRVCQERDDAREQLQTLLRKFQPPQILPLGQVLHEMKPSNRSSKAFELNYDLSLATSCQSQDERSSNPRKADIGASRDIMVDSTSVVIDKQDWGKTLPEKGRLEATVSETGPVLGRQQNQYKRGHEDDKAGVIPISLSLAFPGNSCGPSKTSSESGSRLSVKNEPMSYEDMDSNMHNSILNGKKRRFL